MPLKVVSSLYLIENIMINTIKIYMFVIVFKVKAQHKNSKLNIS